MNAVPRQALTLALCWLGAAMPAFADGLKVTALRTEYLANPQGLDVPAPRLTWQLTATDRGQRQTAYRILVAGEAKDLAAERGTLWDSGKVADDETVNIPYGGKTLKSGQAVFWKVKAWDRSGQESEWSSPATWSMGLLDPGDWKARWITDPDLLTGPLHTNRATLHLPPARHYRKTFEARRGLRRAVVHLSALGIYELYLNGRRVGDAFFAPGWADYHQRVHYRTHDVTELLQRGENSLGAIVADGWYAGYVGYGLLVGYGPGKVGRYFYGRAPALRAQLDLEYSDGSRETVGTSSAWQVTADGPYREADLIMGETYDARREDPNWCGGDAAPRSRSRSTSRNPEATAAPAWRWQPAMQLEGTGPGTNLNPRTKAVFHDTLGPREVDLGFREPGRMQSYAAPPIRVTEELKAQRLTEPKPGVYLFDFGQNFAGIVRLKVKGPAGTVVQLRYGEMRHPDGRLMTENLRRARATDSYTLRGDPQGETWEARFTYHGFQFVELTGLPTKPGLDTVTGLVLHNDTPLVGEFACSDDVMTRFWKNTQWTQRANFVEIPTDCPQRDERLGWMGDAQIYVRTATFNADVAAFFTKWLDDLVESQRESGAYPDYAPYPMAHGAPGQTWGTAWTDAGVICPWTVWRVYGDTRVVERMWPSLTRFMKWRQQRAPDLRGRKDGNTWGDWLNVNESTPIEYVDAAYFALDARMMADLATALGREPEAAAYRKLNEAVRAAFQKDYLKPDGTLSVDTQTAYALAIGFRLAPDDATARFAEILAAKVARNDGRMATGFLGTKALLPALTAGGQHDIALSLFQSRRFPSWGYEVVNGATTVWERWDSYTREHGFNGANGDQNAAMNSFSHYAFGAVMEWGFRNLAGIDALEPGYRKIAIAPRPPAPAGRGLTPTNVVTATTPKAATSATSATSATPAPPLTWVRASYDSIRGRITSAWRREGDRLVMEVTVPANTTAVVRLPTPAPGAVTEGGRLLSQAADVKFVDAAEGRLAVEIGSGTYRFEMPYGGPAR